MKYSFVRNLIENHVRNLIQNIAIAQGYWNKGLILVISDVNDVLSTFIPYFLCTWLSTDVTGTAYFFELNMTSV